MRSTLVLLVGFLVLLGCREPAPALPTPPSLPSGETISAPDLEVLMVELVATDVTSRLSSREVIEEWKTTFGGWDESQVRAVYYGLAYGGMFDGIPA